MATFTHEVSPYRRKDGTFLIKIRMTHRRRTLRKPSGIYATAAQLNRDRTRIRDAALLDAVNRVTDRLRMAAANVEGAAFMDAEALWSRIAEAMEDRRGFRLDFFAFADTVIGCMERGTAAVYRAAVSAFSRHLGRATLDVNEIDRAMAVAFKDWIEERHGRGCRSASLYLSCLRTIHSRARDRYNDPDTGLVRIPREPFKGIVPKTPTTQHRALTLEQLKAVISCLPKTKRGRLGRDVFALSFYLIGINTSDLYSLKRDGIRDGVLTYNRRKTDSRRDDGALMKVRVEPEAAALLDQYKGRSALLRFADMYADFPYFNKAVNEGLREVRRLTGIEGLTSYHARHTWATLARNECGVPFDTVAEALNHSRGVSERVTDIYIRRDWSRVWDANRLVLDLLR